MQHYIYGLFDPRDDQIRYVGRTTDLKKRFKDHRNYTSDKNAKDRWVLELKSLGLLPVMKELASVSGDDIEETEKYYIKYYLKQGANLTNKVLYKNDKVVSPESKQQASWEAERNQLYSRSFEAARTIGELTERERRLNNLTKEAVYLRSEINRFNPYRVLFWVLLVLFVVSVVIFSILLYINT